mgnify:CR=1 FL=1
MEAGKTVRRGKVRAATGRPRGFVVVNPLRAVWWLFTNVRFAIVLLAILSAASLVGVVVPQVPANMRGDVVAEGAWLKVQENRFGGLTQPMDRLGLFDVFHARWFAILLMLTTLSTAAYVVSRAPGIWRTVTRPRKRVPDRYLQMAPHRLYLPYALDVGRLEAVLRRARYRVERWEEGGAVYLFGDRFQWAQLGTLLTHAAVIVFILSAVISRMDSFSAPLFLSEGATAPVLPAAGPRQMQLELANASASFTPEGRPLDYRSEMVIYERGEEVKRCESTVNSPCAYGGFRFYQSAYFGYGAAVEVRDMSTGNAVYVETLALSDTWPSPHVVIKGSDGAVLVDDSLVLTDNLELGGVTYTGSLLELPGGRTLTVGLRVKGKDESLAVFEPGEGPDVARLLLKEGETAQSGGLTVSYVRAGRVPAALVPDFPLPASLGQGPTGQVFLQMSNVFYGTGRASEGMVREVGGGDGPPRLTISGLGPRATVLEPGESVVADGLEYRFEGQREFSGITAKRDRSDTFVWVGAGLTVLGLMMTFWVPRRRLWAKITESGTWLAGQAASHARYGAELRQVAREAGASGLERTDDDD